MKKEIIFDLETTGLSKDNNAIMQFACMYFEDDVLIDEINLDINPFTYNKKIIVSDEALEITGKTIDQLKKYPNSKDMFKFLISWLNEKVDKWDKADKITLVGYNSVSFDIPFLREWFNDNNVNKLKNKMDYFGSYFNYYSVDVFQLAQILKINNLINVNRLRLIDVAGAFNFKFDAHDAMEDVKATEFVYRKMQKIIGVV